MDTNLRNIKYWMSKTAGKIDQLFDGKFHTWGQRWGVEGTDFFAVVEKPDGTCIELDTAQIAFINTDTNNTVAEKERQPDLCNCTPHCPPHCLTTETIKRIVHMEHSITIVLGNDRKYLYPSGSVLMFENDTVFIDYKKDKH